MPIEFGALLFAAIKKIVFAAISKRVVYASEGFLTKRKIESRVDDSIAQVVEQLLPFFENEHISEKQRELLLSTCSDELSEILTEPKEFFAASLDGQKVFDRRYASGRLPQVIREERLEDLYALIFPQVANLVCAYPPAVEQWKIEGYRDGFRRLDEIALTLGNVANKLDQLASKDADTADVLLGRVRQSLTQRVEFQLDLTGLRGDRPDAVPLEKCFIVPELVGRVEDRRSRETRELRIGNEAEISAAFDKTAVRGVVVGVPGSGKSTWSYWLQRRQLTNGDPRLAVLVRLRELIKSDRLPSHQELVRDAAGTHLREEVDIASVRKWCKAGSITFILDGFDEIPPEKRDAVLSWIRELAGAIEKAGLILTSRPLTTAHLAGLQKTWLTWDLLPFDEPRITEYISKWYASAPLLADKQRDVDAKELAQQWVNDPALLPLVGTPLMLATILMVHHMDGELPRGRAKLYERYVDGMLGLWDSRWGVSSAIEISLDLKKRVLTRLALHFHMEEIEQLGDTEIENLIAVILPAVGCAHSKSAVLDHLRERTGLLIGPGTWSFVHKNVGEFLVASAIQDGDQVDTAGQKLDRLRLFKERHNDRWNTTLFFWAGLTSPGDLQSFIEQVAAESQDRDFLLALGLVYDQLQPHRLTEPWRRNQLLKLIETGLKDPSRGQYYCGDFSGEGYSVDFPSHQLRGLQEVFLHHALLECLRASNIDWEEAGTCDSSLRFVIWCEFATDPRTLRELTSALSSRSRPKPLPRAWLMFPFTWGIGSAIRPDAKVQLDDYIRVLAESFPRQMSRIVLELVGCFENLPTNIDNLEIESVLTVLASLKDQDVDDKCLKSTVYDLEVPSIPLRTIKFDLLSKFLDKLEAIVLQNIVPQNLTSEARTFVASLRNRRDTLLDEESRA